MNLENRFKEKEMLASPSKYRSTYRVNNNLAWGTKNNLPSSQTIYTGKMEKSTKGYVLQTLRLMSKGKLREAKDVIEQVIDDGFNHADAYFIAGEVDRQLGLIATAEEKLLRTLTFQVFTPKAYFSLGLIYNEKAEFDKAIRCLKKFLFTIETPEAHFQLAKALLANDEAGDAAIHFNRAVVLSPNEPTYYLERAR